MRRAALALVLLLVVAGCGVPEDDHPQELSADQVPPGLLTTPTTTTEATQVIPPERQARLYYVNADGQVTDVIREVEDQSPEAIITALLETDPLSLEGGLSTSIPPETSLLDIALEDDILTVDLSEEFTTVQGQGFINAVAQIVFTATADDLEIAVAFQQEGEPIPVRDQNSESTSDPVTRSDYSDLLAPTAN